MKTREEFVEELATVMCEEFGTEACEEYCGSNVCANRFIAEKLYDAGYRKQSDTVREFVEKLRDKEFSAKIGSEWVAVVKSLDIDEIVKDVCGE